MKKLSMYLIAATMLVACGRKSGNKDLISEPLRPAGITWKKMDIPHIGTAEVPSGDGWEVTNAGHQEFYNKKLDLTIMVQNQPGDAREQAGEFTKGLIDANKRDAPKYKVINEKQGSINGNTASLIDGTFNNGTEYATRDYIIFKSDGVLSLMCRAAKGHEKEMQAIIDYMTASVK